MFWDILKYDLIYDSYSHKFQSYDLICLREDNVDTNYQETIHCSSIYWLQITIAST